MSCKKDVITSVFITVSIIDLTVAEINIEYKKTRLT